MRRVIESSVKHDRINWTDQTHGFLEAYLLIQAQPSQVRDASLSDAPIR